MRILPARPGLLHRVFAVVCLGLVVFLGAAGVNAELHASAHAAQKAAGQDHDYGCAVDLFAQGLAQLAGAPQLAALPDMTGVSCVRTAEPAVPTKPAGLHPPGRGPPLE